jgi:hypothetical protein
MTVAEHIDNLPLPVKKIVKALRSIARIIQGEGKRIRHVKIYSVAEAGNKALEKLVEVAWSKAEKDVAGWRKSLKRKNKA